MEIKFTEKSDATLIHDLMIKAFMEYRNEVPPSSALEETVQSISVSLEDGERGLICYLKDDPVGMVRFKLIESGIYFYRLAVIPEKQGQGIARKILNSLEDYASKQQISTILCKVRITVPKNIKLYSSIGYIIYDEEVVQKLNGINIKVVSMIKQVDL